MRCWTFALPLLTMSLFLSACSSSEDPPNEDAADPQRSGPGRVDPKPKTPMVVLTELGGQFGMEDGKAKTLTLAKSNVTDAGLAHLKDMATLESLNLFRTGISDAGLVHLQGLTGLRLLVLNETAVTDAGLEHLKGLAALQSLDLEGTAVTDNGLEHLHGLSDLRQLNLEATKVTPLGIQRLQEALPELEIQR